MRETTILIKPASASCNCVCTYCFYDDVSNCRSVKTHGIIQEEVWKKLVDDVFSSQEKYEKINFLFQGGEPLLAGIKFFEQFVAYVKKHQSQEEVTYGLQTNGTLLNDIICQFLKQEHFMVGISIDGYRENHNRNRFLREVGSYDEVMRGLDYLRTYEIEHNVLTVLTKQLAKQPEKLYAFYKAEHIEYVQIIPCLANLGKSPEEDLYACTPALFGSFYKRFYQLWMDDFKKQSFISENFIENILSIFLGQYPSRCGMLGVCEKQCIVEANGSIYPCDFYVMDEYEMGNIKRDGLDEIMCSSIGESFKADHQIHYKPCKQCRYEKICHGNCKRMRASFIDDDYCGYQDLLDLITAQMDDIYQVIHAVEQ